MKKRTFFIVLAVCCLLTLLLSSIKVANYFMGGWKTEAAFRALERSAEQMPQQTDTSQGNEQAKNNLPLPDYDTLHERNPDYWGWIRIDDTPVNYPVMYTPEEPERYLHRDFDGNSSVRGVPFLDGSCTDRCGNLIIYGHHMNDSTMFGTLPSYAKEDYWRSHPTILLRTADGEHTYEVMAAFYSKVYDQKDTDVFRYYQYTDLTDPDDFKAYMEQVTDAALYDTGVTAEYGDQLLTLSTCSYHTSNGRFVVAAKNITE